MDLSAAFSPGHDRPGKRLRSLELYGIPGRFRTSDGFVVALDHVVRCAAHFTASDGAALVLWPGTEHVVLARSGAVADDAVSRLVAPLWNHLERSDESGAVVDLVDGTTVVAAPVVGREGVPFGLLTTWRTAAGTTDPETGWLVEQLARAAVAALEERRRVLGRRHSPRGSVLRLSETVDRRRPSPPNSP